MNTVEVKSDMDELKASINMMSEELNKISKQQVTIMGLMNEIRQLKEINEEQKNRINSLETRVSDLEQYTRMNDVIISGLSLKPTSYAHAMKGIHREEEGYNESDNTIEAQVTDYLLSKNIHIDKNGIEACHTIKSQNKTAQPVVIVRFFNRKNKVNLLRQGKNLKGTNVYMNEHLTKINADLAKRARFLKKQGKIQATWTSNCRIYVKLNGSPEEAKVLCIRSMEQLEKLSNHQSTTRVVN